MRDGLVTPWRICCPGGTRTRSGEQAASNIREAWCFPPLPPPFDLSWECLCYDLREGLCYVLT